MEDNKIKSTDVQKTKKISFGFRLVGFVMILAFAFQPLHSINNHTYTTGVDNFHYSCGCFGCWATHLSNTCDKKYSTHFL